jgi:SM-20-related protein
VSPPGAEETFGRLGVLTKERFLEPELCARLRVAMISGRAEAATMRHEGGDYQVDEGIRRARRCHVDEAIVGLVEERLLGAREEISQAFDVPVGALEELQFVIYGEGDYIRRHVDRSPNPDDGHHSRERAVSAVLLLNGQNEDPGPDEYAGGALAFYEPWKPEEGPVPVELEGREGMLVGFPPGTLHEVKPITRGERFSVVSWFTQAVFRA